MGTQATIFVSNQYAQNIIDEKWKQFYDKV
jgi:hypothetical protein